MSTAWMDLDTPGPTALCATNPDAKEAHRAAVDTEEFGKHRERVYLAAKEWCLECPVRQACLEYALAVEVGPSINRAGVLGGMTPNERAELTGHGRKGDPVQTRERNRELRMQRRHAQAAALEIACPTCKQPRGKRCVSGRGNVTEPHLARVLATEEAA